MTPRANAARMLAAARRNVDQFHGELFAIYVVQPHLTEEDRMANERNATLARAQEAHLDVLEGQRPGGDDPRLRAAPPHHADVRRPHAASGLDRAAVGGTPLDRLVREAERHGRPRLSPVTPMTDSTGPRGRLKVFLGYAAGVGKTYQMLTEAQAEARDGVDVVIAYFEPHGRPGHDRPHRGPRDHSAAGDRVPRARGSRRWTRDGRPRVAGPGSPSSTSSRTRTCPARPERSGGRTCTNCSTRASTC